MQLKVDKAADYWRKNPNKTTKEVAGALKCSVATVNIAKRKVGLTSKKRDKIKPASQNEIDPQKIGKVVQSANGLDNLVEMLNCIEQAGGVDEVKYAANRYLQLKEIFEPNRAPTSKKSPGWIKKTRDYSHPLITPNANKHSINKHSVNNTCSQLEEACYVIYKILSENQGQLPAKDVMAMAKKATISVRTLKRAKQRLGVYSRKVQNETLSEWVWYLPNDETPLLPYKQRASNTR